MTDDREETASHGGRRNKGKTWSWGTLKPDAKIVSVEHLMFRYLVESEGYTAEELARIAETTVPQIKKGIYGRFMAARKNILMAIAQHIGESWENLSQMAQQWHAGEWVDVLAKIPSRDMSPKKQYSFSRLWLRKHNWEADKLCVIKQTTDNLAADGIAQGDILLVNTADKQFQAGSFYAAVINGAICATMGSMRGRHCLLVVESAGRKFLDVNFDEIEREDGIIGRIVWRGGRLP